MIKASKFTHVDKGLIPTGELRAVAGTPFDFNKPTPIGARVENDDEQLKFGKGYDHNWVLDRQGKELELVASLYEPTSGRFMEVLTTEPGLQFYAVVFSTGQIRVRVAPFTNTVPVSAWRRSTFQIRRTTRTFRRLS